MEYIPWARAGIDCLILVGITLFGLKLLRFQGVTLRTERLVELESSLRRVISDAQSASTALNQELLKRQRDLERLLFDIETSEQRLNRVITNAELQKSSLELDLRRMDRAAEPHWTGERPVAAASALQPERAPFSTPQPAASASRTSFPTMPIELPVSALEKDEIEPKPAPRDAARRSPAGQMTNIYGDPVPTPAQASATTATRTPKAPLRGSIEKFETPVTSERAYDTAEKLLAAGIPVATVAEKLRLPEDEVRMIGQLVQREQQAKSVLEGPNAADPRLGVLSPVHREVRTV